MKLHSQNGIFKKKGVDNLNPLCYNNYRKTEREVMIMMELYLFGGIYVGGLLLAGFIAVASIYAQKHPNKKFSKWWYND